MQNLHAILGSHTPGRLYSSIYFPISSFQELLLLGIQNKINYKSEDNLIALITFYHEAIHLFQDLYLGISCLADQIKNNYKDSVFDLFDHVTLKGEIIDIPFACGQSFKLDNACDGLLKKAAIAHRTYEHILPFIDGSEDAVRKYVSHLKKNYHKVGKYNHKDILDKYDLVFESMNNLTTLSLYECHAALLTQQFVELLISSNPNNFDKSVLDKLSSIFMVSKMQNEYCKPYNIFKIISENFLHFDKLEYQFLPNSPLSEPILTKLLIAILDVSLHIPPLEYFSITKERPTYDINLSPLYRFIYCSERMIPWFHKQAEGTVFSIDTLYNSWIDEISPGPKFCHITECWVKHYEQLNTENSEIDKIRLTAMNRRLNSPDLWKPWRLFDLIREFSILEIPIIYEINGRPSVFPVYDGAHAINEEKIKDEFERLGKLEKEEHRRAVEQDLADLLFLGDTMCCPEAKRIDFIKSAFKGEITKCISKNELCNDFFNTEVLPENDCIVTKIVDEHKWKLKCKYVDASNFRTFVRTRLDTSKLNFLNKNGSNGFFSGIFKYFQFLKGRIKRMLGGK